MNIDNLEYTHQGRTVYPCGSIPIIYPTRHRFVVGCNHCKIIVYWDWCRETKLYTRRFKIPFLFYSSDQRYFNWKYIIDVRSGTYKVSGKKKLILMNTSWNVCHFQSSSIWAIFKKYIYWADKITPICRCSLKLFGRYQILKAKFARAFT